MYYVLLLGVLLPLSVVWVWLMLKDKQQRALDATRKYYQVTFPADMDDKRVHAFIRAIGSNLRGGTVKARPTIVFEMWSSPQGIIHRLRVPEDDATYLIGQLQNSLPGIDITEVEDQIANLSKMVGFQFGAQLFMRNASEELPIVDAVDYSHRVLGSMQDAVKEHDTICVQWIIGHSPNQKMPASDKPLASTRSPLLKALLNGKPAGRDEVKTRRSKQVDQNYIATARIAARGSKIVRAEQLVRQVVRAYTSEGGYAHFIAKKVTPQQISHDIKLATTPLFLTAQLNVRELAAVIGWPMSDRYVPGLSRGATRHLPASETIARQGRILGVSSMPGIDRQIAQSYESAVTHMYIAGGTGVGKTTLMVNTIRQDMDAGAGIILIEREGNLFQQALDQVPPHRMQDVICIDLTNSDRPVGLNLLKTAPPEVVAGQLADLLAALYDTSINANKLVRHGIPVLARLPRATIADLITLVHPRTVVDKQWARAVVSQHPDKTIRQFWEDWYKQDDKKITNDSEPLKNRMWELLTPEPTRYLLNQETSSFDPVEVVQGNKLLFVNLSGVSEQAASLIGTMLVTAIWTAAKRFKDDDLAKPNFMYLDEFQQFSHLSHDFENMLAEARKHKLGLVMATQYIERLKPVGLQDAVMTNARTKVIFNSSAKSSMIHWQDFASTYVRQQDFMNLKAHQALARVNTKDGISEPITIKTFKQPAGYKRGAEILALSSHTYGRNKTQIDSDDATRRIAEPPETTGHAAVGRF